jgi:hypothetical protein
MRQLARNQRKQPQKAEGLNIPSPVCFSLGAVWAGWKLI